MFVTLKPICDALGLSWGSQHNRIQRDPILSEGIFTTKMPSIGGAQETTLLRLDLMNGWLFTIEDSRIKDPIVREKVLTYKRECYAVLFAHFYGKDERPEPITPPQQTEEAEGPKVRLVTEARHTFGNPTAAQLWFRLGLPVVPAMYHDPRQLDLLDVTAAKPAEVHDKAA